MIEDTILKIEAAKRAQGDPLPGELANALDPSPIMVGGIKVRPVVPADWIMLKRLDSPIYKIQVEDKKDEIPITEEDSVELMFQFTRPPQDSRAALASGRESFREQAMREIADKFTLEQMRDVSAAVNEQLRRYYATIMRYAADDTREGAANVKERNFQEQPTSD